MTKLDRIYRYLFLTGIVLHVGRHEPAAVSRVVGVRGRREASLCDRLHER